MDKILIKRGTKEKLEKSQPLSQGELFLAKDEERLYVGGPKGNIPIATQQEVDEKATKTEVDELTGRVSTVESTIQQHEDILESKIDAGEARSIFRQEASSFTLYLADYDKRPEDISDSERIQRVLDQAEENSVIIFPHHTILEIHSEIEINKPVHIVGNGTELRTISNGLDPTFKIIGVNGFSIEGLKFNQNLRGRTSIVVHDCSNFIIKDCYFTGYSKEFGYDGSDGGIRVEKSQTGKIINNTWEHHGDQYGVDTEGALNRCITLHGGTKDILVDGNLFSNVNQTIVTVAENITISNNLFKGVHDNGLYLINSSNITVSGNNFIDGHDEGIVLVSCENVTITGNNIKEVPNKHFAIDGTCRNINITGNNCENIEKKISNFLAYRQPSAMVENLTIVGNVFKSTVNENNYDRFNISNVRNLIMMGNIIEIETVSNQRIISFRDGDVVTGNISNNVIRGTAPDTNVLAFSGTQSERKLIFDDNEIYGRFRLEEGIQANGYNVHPVLAYGTSQRINRMVYADNVPNFQYGYWYVGDLVINTNEAMNITGWVCTKSGLGTEAEFKEI